MDLVVVVRQSLVTARLADVRFGVWTGAPVVLAEALALIDAVEAEAETEGKVALLVGIPAKMPIPDEPVRVGLAAGMARIDRHVLAGATVVDDTGFAASGVRAVVTAIQFFSGPKHPERVFATGERAARFLAAERARAGRVRPGAAEILAAFESLTRAHWRR